jgi:hypothetical protein
VRSGFLVAIAGFVIATATVVAPPSRAGEVVSGWVPVDDGLGNGWGSNRPFWWGDLGPSPYWGGTSWDQALPWPYNTTYGPASTYTYRVGRAVPYHAPDYAPAPAQEMPPPAGLGAHCATPVKTCLLRQISTIGGACSCKVAGGPARGAVVP